MERRHQVFISSTYSDLKDERSEVTQALLELDCFPAGMELFPATTQGAWDLIKGVIDDSDYYCLIVGGRYGSTDAIGISYTEKEYDYAIATSKPLMAFIHRDPGEIPNAKTEKSDLGRKKLEGFRKKVEDAHHCKYWNTAAELGGLVSRSLVNLRKTNPAEGWVRGKFAATDLMLLELANLRARVAELVAESSKSKSRVEQSADSNFAGGEDTLIISCTYKKAGEKERISATPKTTWNNVLKYVGPALLTECSDREFDEKLQLCVHHQLDQSDYSSIVIPHVVVDKIKIQLRALGQMVPGSKRRAVADKEKYWVITDLGEQILINTLAILRPKPIENPLEKILNTMQSSTPKKL
jgi:hypothetical protein